MFRTAARLTLRRGLHTARPRVATATATATASRQKFAVVFAGSAAASAYLLWQMNAKSQVISADASTSASKTAHTSDTPSHTSLPSEDLSHRVAETMAEGEAEMEEGEAGAGASQGAYNPETGEINWDCPCLGGMAHGPCGQQFREAFSCFVYSEDEPKGINCVDKFKAMQDCFREHPDVYGEEIMRDDEDEEDSPALGSPHEDAELPGEAGVKADRAVQEGISLEASTGVPES
ncbi:hypothetical protein EVG20_g7932 [Dentipellis fragilis]|uniref:Mitochondrial intermembrane space import and assembly protein 40 n=1 Tax=Dentipellis fragilis TaxID=205917 RepID=A0A4Y9YC50_9AGAM|nr:hypothetical protein EVG20_g7932 [Dentipellis fragilis]